MPDKIQKSAGTSANGHDHPVAAEAPAEDSQPAATPVARTLAPMSRTVVSPINADRPVFTLSVAADLLGMHPRTLRI